MLIDLGHEADRAELMRVWRVAKFPVLLDDARQCSVPESSIIIEYLSRYYPGPVTLLPQDPISPVKRACSIASTICTSATRCKRSWAIGYAPPVRGMRSASRRPRPLSTTAYGMIEDQLADKTWAMGDSFSLADCSAAPALLYANVVHPLGATFPRAAAYLKRLCERPSYARVLREAEPFWAIFPKEP